jgi:hypothetical protein
MELQIDNSGGNKRKYALNRNQSRYSKKTPIRAKESPPYRGRHLYPALPHGREPPPSPQPQTEPQREAQHGEQDNEDKQDNYSITNTD